MEQGSQSSFSTPFCFFSWAFATSGYFIRSRPIQDTCPGTLIRIQSKGREQGLGGSRESLTGTQIGNHHLENTERKGAWVVQEAKALSVEITRRECLMLRRPVNRHLASRNFTAETSLFVRGTDGQSGARNARYGSQTERIIVGRLNVALRRWTISVLGQCTLYMFAR